MTRPDCEQAGMTPRDYFLYAVMVFGWSTSWIMLKQQLGIVAPEVSLFWRYLAAALLMFGLSAMLGQRLHFAASIIFALALGLFVLVEFPNVLLRWQLRCFRPACRGVLHSLADNCFDGGADLMADAEMDASYGCNDWYFWRFATIPSRIEGFRDSACQFGSWPCRDNVF